MEIPSILGELLAQILTELLSGVLSIERRSGEGALRSVLGDEQRNSNKKTPLGKT
jgi:hypothetical protein